MTLTSPPHRGVCFAQIDREGEIRLNTLGELVEAQWLAMTQEFPQLRLHEYVIMPDHFHALVEFRYDVPERRALPQIIKRFKARCTRELNRCGLHTRTQIWKRGFHDYVLRDEIHLAQTRAYIENNPRRLAERCAQ